MEVFVRPAVESDIEKILPYIEQYCLDGENMDNTQFYIADIGCELAGFGRLKCYGEVYELATLGVLENYRGNGIGSKIVQKIIEAVPSNEIWITTIIPNYFKQFGFVEDDNIPDEIFLKCQRVCGKLNKTTQNSHYMCCRKENVF